ncbi:hypothetical protein RMS29_000820 [Agrobacterium rosae]|uniref:Uncharacterized protein n=1 Tax=Agrobacterium rosae TaxID=1972867 RepID=A0AAE5VR78_9HYPH|nr:hypothetical protein [Agrobacterium rosae]KAA3510952.1 hypothetical protein DXM21_15575 [Agrobacterium rosae]KAA3517990.1 hypothetical protein DXM25_15625 [Agrobacterium rosae]MCM2434269.1 hypothetical protein [Agrobacterium rosae]MDX8329464.1 hypothetical protein [Agrobacterium rosae]MQB49551.1 hypothetical protein [Agrobacterium rosae]
MVFILGISLGVAALALRSVTAVAATGILIAVVFAAAALVSASGVHVLSLLIALAGYNVGIAGIFGAMVAVRGLRTA